MAADLFSRFALVPLCKGNDAHEAASSDAGHRNHQRMGHAIAQRQHRHELSWFEASSALRASAALAASEAEEPLSPT